MLSESKVDVFPNHFVLWIEKFSSLRLRQNGDPDSKLSSTFWMESAKGACSTEIMGLGGRSPWMRTREVFFMWEYTVFWFLKVGDVMVDKEICLRSLQEICFKREGGIRFKKEAVQNFGIESSLFQHLHSKAHYLSWSLHYIYFKIWIFTSHEYFS